MTGLRRWSALGLLLGSLGALVVHAPARWMAAGLESLTGSRILLAEPAGTVWNGSAQLVLTGGPQSIDRAALDHRLSWRWGPGLKVQFSHPSALARPLTVAVRPTWQGVGVSVEPHAGSAAAELQLPASWLIGLGTPWNTLQPAGQLALKAQRLSLEWSPGQAGRVEAMVALELRQLSSRVSTLPVLGHYEVLIQTPQGQATGVRLTLSSRSDSALQLHGLGRWQPGQRVEFHGEAHAAKGHEAALANLLNIIGRRDGARSVITL